MELAPYAVRDADTAGRRFREPAHPYRSDYQRDRDRIIHSKAFRRLENKTQVFAPDFSDHFRNRLTHTLEVTQIARTIGAALNLNPDLCEVLALSHDIGHPPFGHEGEEVLDVRMQEVGSGFDHNLHALRIVEDFEQKYPAFRGLNLTFEVREGIIKHSRDYDSERLVDPHLAEYLLGQRPPLEAQLIDLADEIAYNTADLDDGVGSGLLTPEQVSNGVDLFAGLHAGVAAEFPAAPPKLLFAETVRRIIDMLVSDLIAHTRAALDTAGLDSLEKVRAHPQRVVGWSDKVARANQDLKTFLRRDLYSHPMLRAARARAGVQIDDLFNFYLARPDALPRSHRNRIDALGIHRVVCDYIAGMTDNYAQAIHSESIGSLEPQ